jgi:hypothetical protein
VKNYTEYVEALFVFFYESRCFIKEAESIMLENRRSLPHAAGSTTLLRIQRCVPANTSIYIAEAVRNRTHVHTQFFA